MIGVGYPVRLKSTGGQRRLRSGDQMDRYSTHTCGALRAEHIGSTVRLSGGCHRIRDHGGVLFIDRRVPYGVSQIVADPYAPAFQTAEKVYAAWVVRVDGRWVSRPTGPHNPD